MSPVMSLVDSDVLREGLKWGIGPPDVEEGDARDCRGGTRRNSEVVVSAETELVVKRWGQK